MEIFFNKKKIRKKYLHNVEAKLYPDYPFNSNKVEKLFAYSARIVRSISRKNKRREKYRFKKYIKKIFLCFGDAFLEQARKKNRRRNLL